MSTISGKDDSDRKICFDPFLQANLNVIVISFTAISATAPIAGVLVGGTIVDRVGGYQGYMRLPLSLLKPFLPLTSFCLLKNPLI